MVYIDSMEKDCEETNQEEIEANLFAAELLMPTKFLVKDLRELGTVDDEELVGTLAHSTRSPIDQRRPGRGRLVVGFILLARWAHCTLDTRRLRQTAKERKSSSGVRDPHDRFPDGQGRD